MTHITRSQPSAWLLLAALLLPFALAACSPVPVLNALASTSNAYRLTANVAYGPLPRHMLDVYVPTAAAPAKGWPMAVFFYGGSWTSGERADYAFVGIALAARGVLTVVADYRLYPEVRYPDFLNDSAQALAWGLDHAQQLGADPKRVFVVGHSAGAYNAAMLALDPRWLAGTGHAPAELAGWVGLAGPYDFFPTDNPQAQPVFFHPHYPPRAQPIDWVPTGPASSGSTPNASSPSSALPVFLGAPQKDKLVDPVRSTEQLAARLRGGGVTVTLKRYAGVGHATLIGAFAPPLRWMAPVLDDVVTFIDTTAPR